MDNYVVFRDTNKEIRRGLDIAGHFIISTTMLDPSVLDEKDWTYSIFWLDGILVFKNTVFSTKESARDICRFILWKYGPFLSLHDAFPEHNLFSLMKWTVKDGLYYSALFEASEYWTPRNNLVINSMMHLIHSYDALAKAGAKHYMNGYKKCTVDNYGTTVEVV